jgi:hypothetical protein
MRELAMLLQERDGLVASLKQSGEASKEALKARYVVAHAERPLHTDGPGVHPPMMKRPLNKGPARTRC